MGSVAALILLATLCLTACGSRGDSPHRVYVLLGLHSNFYHSWRGDTPDESGFGTDIRLVRFLIDELDRAHSQGLDARVYWDHDNLFTLGSILPSHAPDILDDLRRRVDAGLDEVVLGAFSNGLTGAMTEKELSATLRWAISNPWESGTRDVFGTHTPVFRPQEGMLTTGTIPILQAAGIEAVVLAYSEWPFNAFSNFVPVLAPEQRYGVTWLRLREDGPRIRLLPAMSVPDVLNHISFERWLLDLREMQVTGELDQDLVLHMNFDADVESWIPQKMPPGLGWFPNTGGVREYIEAVNKYDWAEFTTPSEFLARCEPVGEVVVRQDTADGSFDGHASWAEKFPSHSTWTELERSRLATRRAEAWLEATKGDAGDLRMRISDLLDGERNSSFIQRLRGLSTTHFGMSTPLLNEERQAIATQVVSAARRSAEAAERLAAEQVTGEIFAQPDMPGEIARIAVRDLRVAEDGESVTQIVRLPFLFSDELPTTRLIDGSGGDVPHSWVNLEVLGDTLAAELWVSLELAPSENRRLTLLEGHPTQAPSRGAVTEVLANDYLQIELGSHGIERLVAGDWQVGGADFLTPFVTYRSGVPADSPTTFAAQPFAVETVGDERLQGLERARLVTQIPISTPAGEVRAKLRIDLSLPESSPWLLADVDIAYPYTRKDDLLHTNQQKLRRYLDNRWIEVGPLPLTPRLAATLEEPLTVWKHNFLDVTSSFELDYHRINPRNAELDAFNHQITSGWVAVADGSNGLLLADNAEVRTSFAFAPMRLRTQEGLQVLSINPFGTYHGRQLAYDHLGGNGIGTEFGTLHSSAVRPNGPSYNGMRERFSLLIAPYSGDEPPERLQAEAEAFFHPPAVMVKTAHGVQLPGEMRAKVDRQRLESARTGTEPIAPPRAFLANPSPEAADLVWDPPNDPRVSGYTVEWRATDAPTWSSKQIGVTDRVHIDDLEDGHSYGFRIRAEAGDRSSSWTASQVTEIGPEVPADSADLAGNLDEAPLGLLLRTFWYGLKHLMTTP